MLMVEAARLEQWKQITWLRAGWTMKPADAAELNEWNPLFQGGGGKGCGKVEVDADFNRAMGEALRLQQQTEKH